MNKTELINSMAAKSGLNKKQTAAALEAFTDTVTETLASGGNVALIGWGTFSTSVRASRSGINPSTGDKIQIAESTVAKFKVGAHLKAKVNSK